jgi:hypothetical protein
MDGMQMPNGEEIASILSSKGPVVKCVLLKHMRPTGRDVKPHPASPKAAEEHKREVLVELIEEIEIDTTPSKSEVKKVLGGPFTFLGQYPDEGIILMVRKDLPDDLEMQSTKTLRDLCFDTNIDTKSMVEKQELVSALIDSQLPVNPHSLQPPFDGVVVRGDILLMKVAETDEFLDADGRSSGEASIAILSNEDFFLHYTKAQWVAFASRTDVVAPETPQHNDDSSASEDEEGEDDEDFDLQDEDASDEDASDEDRQAMLNLIMGEVLKKFRSENGRGPNTEELLELRSQVATQLGVEVASIDAEQDRKREIKDEDRAHIQKKVKFTSPEEKGIVEEKDSNAVAESQPEDK